jgi:2-amino-4-hydroxy-6-hydroxymethyldihydropteridine diphosphokinase
VATSPSTLTAFHSTVFLGLGSNLDHPARRVRDAIREIDEIPNAGLVKISSLYQTAPLGIIEQPAFINAVVQVETTLSPHDLLRQLLDIEVRHARVRNEKNGPRTLDLDILIFNEWRIDDGTLTTPHPRMHERAFVLVPLVEIAPEVHIPGKGYARDFLAQTGCVGVQKLGAP